MTLAAVGPAYVTWATELASVQADLHTDLTIAEGAHAVSEAAANLTFLTFLTTLRPAWTARQTGVAAAGTAQKTYYIDRATHSRQLAQGVTPSKTLPQIEAEYTAAKADVLHALEIAEAAARHAWQNTNANADETFVLAEAAAKRNRAVTTANVQKTYADGYYAAYTVYAQSLVAAGADYQRQAADAQQLADVATAQADTQWWTAMYTARAGVLMPLISYNLPWVDFQIAPAHAEADGATSIAPQYVESQQAITDAQASDTYRSRPASEPLFIRKRLSMPFTKVETEHWWPCSRPFRRRYPFKAVGTPSLPVPGVRSRSARVLHDAARR